MKRLITSLVGIFGQFPHSLLAVLGRLSIGMTFWLSGQTKLEGYALCLPKIGCPKLNPFSLSDTTLVLFENDYRLPLLSPWAGAHMAALAEFFLSLALIVGFASRFSALGLLAMTLVIEIFVYPGAYVLHGTWATVLLLIITYGPGKLSLDHVLWRR